MVHVVDAFLSEEKNERKSEVVRMASVVSRESDEALWRYAVEALRKYLPDLPSNAVKRLFRLIIWILRFPGANPPTSVAMRRATRPYTLGVDVTVQPGQEVFASVIEANYNVSSFLSCCLKALGRRFADHLFCFCGCGIADRGCAGSDIGPGGDWVHRDAIPRSCTCIRSSIPSHFAVMLT